MCVIGSFAAEVSATTVWVNRTSSVQSLLSDTVEAAMKITSEPAEILVLTWLILTWLLLLLHLWEFHDMFPNMFTNEQVSPLIRGALEVILHMSVAVITFHLLEGNRKSLGCVVIGTYNLNTLAQTDIKWVQVVISSRLVGSMTKLPLLEKPALISKPENFRAS